MEPLRLLQFWQIPSSDKNTAASRYSDTKITLNPPSETTTTTATNDKDHHSVETDIEDSFFDLDFTVPLKKKHKDFNPNNNKVSARKVSPKPRSPQPRLRLHMLLKNSEEESDKTEDVPMFSLLDIGIGNSPTTSKFQKQRSENAAKRFPKVVIQKYLKLINPFYSRASKRYNHQKVKISDPEVSKTKTTPFSSPGKQVVEKQGIRVHLGKSRLASSGVRSEAPPPARRDDSLLLRHDGIQSAILHCKRSYNSSAEFSVLSRSASDPSDVGSVIPCRNSTEEVKTRTSI